MKQLMSRMVPGKIKLLRMIFCVVKQQGNAENFHGHSMIKLPFLSYQEQDPCHVAMLLILHGLNLENKYNSLRLQKEFLPSTVTHSIIVPV